MTRTFIRTAGEPFDGDCVTPRCEECGLTEYSCECEVEEWPELTSFPGGVYLTMDDVNERIARFFGPDANLTEVEHLGPGRIAA